MQDLDRPVCRCKWFRDGGDRILQLIPIGLREAQAYIAKHHRHHKPPCGYKFAIGVVQDGEMHGVVTVGRPVARAYDDGLTAEVTRLCTDGTKNACSMLYGAAWRASKAMGYKTIITYILETESGDSLHASGWHKAAGLRGGVSWNVPSRPRKDDEVYHIRKWLWYQGEEPRTKKGEDNV